MSPRTSHQLSLLPFENSFVESLPGDFSGDLRPRYVSGVCYSETLPTPVSSPRLIGWSKPCAELLGVREPDGSGPDLDILSGNLVTDSMKPFAARYGGHQFGTWAGQLGDGRAITLGEIQAPSGDTYELQLKGAGPTPYSRRADGRAVLRSSLREFVCSEAMHHLGVPTTRALSLVTTGELVERDMFYDGNPQDEPGAIVTRISPTFIRFGNFEMLAAAGEHDNLKALTDYVIQRFYPELGKPRERVYIDLFHEVCRRTAVMIAHWMNVGFVHGVMNTDNMSILGLTIDYGPYGWLEPYEPGWTPNTTDFSYRRYVYGNQPSIAMWNLGMFARSLSPLVSDLESLESGLERYRTTLAKTYQSMLSKKLGVSSLAGEKDDELIHDLFYALETGELDLTLFFRQLSENAPNLKGGEIESVWSDIVATSSYAALSPDKHTALKEWLTRYSKRLEGESTPSEEIRSSMLRANPKYVLRNYLAQNAIDAAQIGNNEPLERLMKVLEKPYDDHPAHTDLAQKRPEWAKDKPGCATLSCSS